MFAKDHVRKFQDGMQKGRILVDWNANIKMPDMVHVQLR